MIQSENDTTTAKARFLIFAQLNDLYHIDASSDYSDSSSLILPRISTIVRRLRDAYGHDTIKFVIPGDFLAPSCLSREFKAEQMVSVMNTMNVDYVTAGNHEFELDETDLMARLEQSNFKWLLTNFDFCKDLDKRLKDHRNYATMAVFEFSKMLISLVGIMYERRFPDEKKRRFICKTFDPNVGIEWTIEAARDVSKEKQSKIPFAFVALTHQTKKQDLELANLRPELRLIMGGHDHDVADAFRENQTSIVKSLSNARSLRLTWLCTIPFDRARDLDYDKRKALIRSLMGDVLRDALQKIFQRSLRV
jgi:2',3'-cyclic-nucleotide 2'-phosphodiesterase (5'-nucleotidase family)